MIRLPSRFHRHLLFLSKALRWILVFLAFLGIVAAPWGVQCSFIERLTHLRFYWLGGLGIFLLWSLQGKARLSAVAVLALNSSGRASGLALLPPGESRYQLRRIPPGGDVECARVQSGTGTWRGMAGIPRGGCGASHRGESGLGQSPEAGSRALGRIRSASPGLVPPGFGC